MKQIFTLAICFAMFNASKAQVVLNELYASPGSGKHEFFELYNNGVSFSSISLQGYTIVTYFEGAGSEKGFYVLDLPDLNIPPKGYLVGSAAAPFDYQGVSGSAKTHFSWNDLAFLASNAGYLKKWVTGNAIPAVLDGNAHYDEKPVPSNFNDLLFRRTAGGASYSVFIYRYGVLINAFFGGSSSTSPPAFIIAMPKLNVRMAGGGQFTINFATYASIAAEYTGPDAGSDNGYIRTRDGLCGGWVKSSSTVQHTPEAANGSEPGTAGSALISAMIERGATATDSSTLIYRLVSAPASILPVTMEIYIDNGSLPNDLDEGDVFISSKTITTAGTSLYKLKFLPNDANILIAARTTAGCFDAVLMVSSKNILLPVKLTSFSVEAEYKNAVINWQVADNSPGALFEVQRSADASTFTSIAQSPSTTAVGLADYSHTTALNESSGFYRLKITNVNGTISYSKVVELKAKIGETPTMILKTNPVDAYLAFRYNASVAGSANITVYNMSGIKVYASTVGMRKGINDVTINVGGVLLPGTYILEIKNGVERVATKIYKK